MDSSGQVRLEALVSKYLTSKCEFDTFPQSLRQSQFKVCVFEFLPEVWVSDDHHYMEAVFTREAYNDFKKLHAGQKLCKLKDKMILIKRWGLVAKEVDSEDVYTSFMNVKVQLVIEQFQPLLHENLSQVQSRKFENLFEESKEVREIIKSLKHSHYHNTLKKLPKSAALNLNASKVQNTYDLNYDIMSKSTFTEPTNDTDSESSKGMRAFLEKDLKTYKILEIFQVLQNEIKIETLEVIKEKGQVWSYEQITKQKEREGQKQALDFVQVNLQGPENKDQQFKKKKKDNRNKKNGADLEMVQIEKVAKKQVLTEDDILQGRTQPLPKKEQVKEKKPQTPQKHKGFDQGELKYKLMKILNPKLGNRPSFGDDQLQRKTYSTEDLVTGRAVPFLNLGKKDPRQEAMSQLIAYNRLDEDEEQTETEKDEDEEMLEQRRLGVLNNFKMNIYMFQKYVKWQRLHQVSKHPILDYHKKEEKSPIAKMEIEKEEEHISKEMEETDDAVMDQVERIYTEQEEEEDDDEEEEAQPVRRSQRVRKPVIQPKQVEEVEEEMVIEKEEAEENEENQESDDQEEQEKKSEKQGFKTCLGEDDDDDSSKQLDEGYISLQSEGDPGENVELENIEAEIQKEKLQIQAIIKSKPNTQKMLESSQEEVSSVKNQSIQKESPIKEEYFQSAQKKPKLLEFSEKKEKVKVIDSELLDSPQAFKRKEASPKKPSPQKFQIDEEEEEEEIIFNRKPVSKQPKKAFEDDSSDEEEYQQAKSPQKQNFKEIETPKQQVLQEIQEERGTTATQNLKNSPQSSQEESAAEKKQKFEELINSANQNSYEKKKLPSPIAMKKNSGVKAPSDFASLTFGQEQKPVVNLGEKRTGYEIENKQAQKLRFEDSDEEEEEQDFERNVTKLPLRASRKSSLEDDQDVIVPEGNDVEMSPTYSIAPDPEIKEVAPEVKEQFAVKAPFFHGNAEKSHLEDSATKQVPTFGGGAGTPEWHRSCQNSEQMSDKSGATLNQQKMNEKVKQLEEENAKLRSQMMIAQTERYNSQKEEKKRLEKQKRKEEKRRRKEAKQAKKREEEKERLEKDKHRMKLELMEALKR